MRPGRLPDDHPLELEAQRKMIEEASRPPPPDPDKPVTTATASTPTFTYGG